MIKFMLNREAVETDLDGDTPLLWVVRDHFKLKGSKFGCGAGLCGACTMHVDGVAVKTCVTPVAAVAGRAITTIEGLGTPEDLHPLQAAWHEHAVPQCGYCQSGQIMAAAALLDGNASHCARDDHAGGATPLLEAARQGHENCVRLLLQAQTQWDPN